jgi:hypothetical protein
MMDAIVQFLRNAMCCVKDLHWFEDTVLYENFKIASIWKGYSGMEIPEPLDKTTPLEFLISLTQLYAFLSVTMAGFTLAWTSVGKLRRIVRLLESRLNAKTSSSSSTTTTTSTATMLAASRLVNESLLQQAKAAIRGVIVGIVVAPIGIAFFWLFANSWHVTETPWLGGLLGLIDALTIMELCLLPLLAYMIVDARAYFAKVRATKDWMKVVTSGSSFSSPEVLQIQTFEFMCPDWVPFWEAEISVLVVPPNTDKETQRMEEEVKKVETILRSWFPAPKDDAKSDNEKEDKIRSQAIEQAVQTMNNSLSVLAIKGYRELVYFVLNLVAFYGYLMGIMVFYFPDDEAQPTYVQRMKFGSTNAIADWTGNFAGDFMWTIEPMVILISPLYLNSVQSSNNKKKELSVDTDKGKAKTE